MRMFTAGDAIRDLHALACPARVPMLQQFFKTGKGEYAEGDIFIGAYIPDIRKVAKKYQKLSLEDTLVCLKSAIHEIRIFAVIVLVNQFKKGTQKEREEIYRAYLSNTRYINHWDIVDVSAEHIVGGFLYDTDEVKINKLHQLAESHNLWEKRISIIATFYFIRRNQFQHTLDIAEKLLHDKHDLIHKAVGWMLREVGKRDLQAEAAFLDKYTKQMPRTMLRYAIEQFPKELKWHYMHM